MSRLKTLHAAVTGAGSGIGRAIVERFASEEADVTLLDFNRDAADAVAREICAKGGTARAIACDVSDTESVRSAFAQIPALDILVNNAGIAHVGNALTTTPQDMDRLYAVNIRGVYHCIHFGLPKLIERKGGVVLNLASIASKVGLADRFAYSMTKGAVLTMTLSVARDFIGQGIRCNCICPARVHTPFVDGFLAKNYPGRESEMFEKLSAAQPIGRMGEPHEIAALAAYLCSPEASFITGSAYDIDGGCTLLR
ncbi:MAG: SDR family oxidoreductase [Opitutaceae bacterium]|nr:SDR family oxidoreductase [Opitutaceae bacterium]